MNNAAKDIYGDLVVRHHNAARKGDKALQERLYAATILFEEIYPEETAAWTALYSEKR